MTRIQKLKCSVAALGLAMAFGAAPAIAQTVSVGAGGINADANVGGSGADANVSIGGAASGDATVDLSNGTADADLTVGNNVANADADADLSNGATANANINLLNNLLGIDASVNPNDSTTANVTIGGGTDGTPPAGDDIGVQTPTPELVANLSASELERAKKSCAQVLSSPAEFGNDLLTLCKIISTTQR